MKFFVSDLDGTLLDEIDGMSKYNEDALWRMKEAGYEIVIASGRPYHSIKDLGLLKYDPYVISLNGSLVYDKTGKVIYDNPLTLTQGNSLLSYCKERDLLCNIFTDKEMYSIIPSNFIKLLYELAKQRAQNEDELIENMQMHYQMFATLPRYDEEVHTRIVNNEETIYKFEVCHSDQTILTQLEQDMDTSLFVSGSWPTNREITVADVNKGNALKELCITTNTSLADTIAIGDNRNDIEMLQTAGLSIAMGNADDEIKQYADKTTSTYPEHGVALAIDEILRALKQK